MRPKPHELIESCRVGGEPGDNTGAASVPHRGVLLRIIWCDGGGWDHVSVSCDTRTPTWAEMEFVRGLFFGDDEWVMQLSVPRSEHINIHEHCLHLWRPQTADEIELVRLRWGPEWRGEWSRKSPGAIPIPPRHFV